MIAALIFFVLVSASPLNAWSLFGTKPLTPEEKIQQLQKQQVDHPDDPVVNYNLGVALYRINRLQEAQSNFERTLAHIKSHNKLERQALFNKANTELKLTVNMLPPHWEEQKDLDQQIVSEALKTINQAIQEYQKLLDLEPKNIKAQTNKKYADEIKKKLEEKKKQQQQNKQDKQNDKQEKSQDNKQDQQKEQHNEQNNQKQQQSEQQKQEQQAQQQQQNAPQEQQHAESEQAQQPQESSEERRMRALLENLQSDETERQKALVRQNAMNQQPPQQGQKPW